jgi:hypothetical protein
MHTVKCYLAPFAGIFEFPPVCHFCRKRPHSCVGRLERGKPIESDGIEKSGTCYTDHKEKPDLWTGREDAPRAFAPRPAVEGKPAACVRSVSMVFWSPWPCFLCHSSLPRSLLFPSPLPFCFTFLIPAISSLPPIVVHEVQSSATQPGRPVANRCQQGRRRMPWRAELLLSGETTPAASRSPLTAGTQPRPRDSLDFGSL